MPIPRAADSIRPAAARALLGRRIRLPRSAPGYATYEAATDARTGVPPHPRGQRLESAALRRHPSTPSPAAAAARAPPVHCQPLEEEEGRRGEKEEREKYLERERKKLKWSGGKEGGGEKNGVSFFTYGQLKSPYAKIVIKK